VTPEIWQVTLKNKKSRDSSNKQ